MLDQKFLNLLCPVQVEQRGKEEKKEESMEEESDVEEEIK